MRSTFIKIPNNLLLPYSLLDAPWERAQLDQSFADLKINSASALTICIFYVTPDIYWSRMPNAVLMPLCNEQ